jgi:hypothetical protein
MLDPFLKLVPCLVFLYVGIYSILEVIFPFLRGPNFNRWEVDVRVGPSVNIMGWIMILTRPRVSAYRYMSDSAACVVALVVGVICILGAILGIRHVVGVPEFIPDLFARF